MRTNTRNNRRCIGDKKTKPHPPTQLKRGWAGNPEIWACPICNPPESFLSPADNFYQHRKHSINTGIACAHCNPRKVDDGVVLQFRNGVYNAYKNGLKCLPRHIAPWEDVGEMLKRVY